MDLWTEGKPDEKAVEVPWDRIWETKKLHYSLVVKIDSQGATFFWTLTLQLIKIDSELNPRPGCLGPFFVGKIHDILEEDLPRLLEFEAILEKAK